jgi:hypothetical protein
MLGMNKKRFGVLGGRAFGAGGWCAVVVVAWWVLSPLGCGSDEDDRVIRSSAALISALEEASSGDVLAIGGTTLRGSFAVPAGVTVEGTDYTLVVAEGGAAFVLEGGSAETPTVLRNVTVRVDAALGEANTGVIVRGGRATIESVAVEAELGMGMVARDVERLVVSDTLIVGTLTDDFLSSAGSETLSPARIGIAGLAVRGGEVEIDRLEIRDFAGFGAVFVETRGSWRRGRVFGVAGTGVLIEASELALEDVAVHDGRRSPFVGALDLGFGVVISKGSVVETQNLEVVRIAGIGVLQDSSTSAHDGLRAIANGRPGVWAQSSRGEGDGPDLRVTRAVLQGNRGAGIQLLDINDAEIAESIVCDTVGRPSVVGEVGVQVLCDGLQIGNVAGRPGTVRLSDVALFGNGRLGVLARGEAVSAEQEAGAGLVTICGNTAIGDEWSCSLDERSVQRCVRTGGPRLAAGWDCADGPGGVVCTTTDAALLDSEPRLLAAADGGLPDDEACRAEVERLTEAAALVAGLGLRWELEGLVGPNQWGGTPDDLVGPNQRPDDTEGLVGPNQLPTSPLARSGNEWRCETSGGAHDGELTRSDDRDNPSGNDGPGWTCSDGAGGRVCTFSANGLLLAGGAQANLSQVTISSPVAARDALALPDSFQLHAVLPTLCTGTEPCAGVAGGSVLGDDTLVDASGRIRGVLGPNGLEAE